MSKIYIGMIIPVFRKTKSQPLLSFARNNISGGHIGDFAFFIGGYKYPDYCQTVDVVNGSLTRCSVDPLTTGRAEAATTSINDDFVLVYGGRENVGTMEVYDSSLTHTIISDPLIRTGSYYYPAASSVGDFALFAGGANASGNPISTVVSVNDSLTCSTLSSGLSVARYSLSSGHIFNNNSGNFCYALFAGGATGSGSSYKKADVDAFNTSLTRSKPSNLFASGSSFPSAHVGLYTIFGSNNSSYSNGQAYNSSLSSSNVSFGYKVEGQMATSYRNNLAIFAGGHYGNTYYNTVVDFDDSLTKSVIESLSYKPQYTTTNPPHTNTYSFFPILKDKDGAWTDLVDIYSTYNATRAKQIV